MYIYEQPEWPDFRWDSEQLLKPLSEVRLAQGKLLGQMQMLGFSLKNEAFLQTLTQDILKTSEIEGERLDQDQVRSSVARRLGIDVAGLPASNRHIDGIVEMMLDATGKYSEPLNAERLFGWHGAMFPTGRSGLSKINVAQWRDDDDGPMQVVSGAYGKEKIHYQAPDAKLIDSGMTAFFEWFNQKSDMDLLLKAGMAHLWFVTIHPFDDGNGRIARAIADMVLARSENSPQRFYSMSAQIQQERKTYYDLLEKTQKGDLDITPWLLWFLNCLLKAIEGAETDLNTVINKARFWEQSSTITFNERQRKVVNQLLDGFEGKLTTSKWAKLTNCSQDSAYRDILDLMDKSILVKNPEGGRSTNYTLSHY